MGQANSTHPIHSAGRTGDVSVVRRYIKNPAIVNRRDLDDMTCLHWAAQLGQIDIIRELAAAKAILDAQDVNGWTPLMHACCRGHKLAVGTLLAAGASVDVESCDGRTALHRAATWKRVGALDQLIEAGGNVRHEAHNKWTPLHCAAAAGDAHCCALLVDAGADADAEDVCGLKPVDVVADISATNNVSQALTRGQRDSRIRARQQRPSACVKLAIPLPTLPSSPDSPPVNSLRDLGKDTLKADTAGPLLPSLDLGRSSSSSSVPSSAAFDKEGAGQSTGSEDSSERRTKSESAKFTTVKTKVGSHGQRDATARRGSWTRPVGTLLGPGRVDGVDGDGCPLSGPAEGSGRAHRSRSSKVAVVSDGVESGAQVQGHHGQEVVRDVARDVVSRNASENHADTSARLGPTDPLCMEERGFPSAPKPIAHRRKDEANGRNPPAGVASFLPREIGESGAAVRGETGGAAGILSRG